MTSLVRHGHSGTTMARVQDYAGVSRGSLTHHFASMQVLLAAAIGHVADRQFAELTALIPELESNDDPDGLVTLLHQFMSGPLFVAGLELWLAARTDDTLRAALAPAERDLGRRIRTALETAGIVGSDGPLSRDDLDNLLVLLRGLAVTQILRDDDITQQRQLRLWARLLRSSPTERPS